MNRIINYSRQNISKTDLNQVNKVLRSDFITQGPKIDEFEKKIKKYCNSKYAVACNSATSGLHIACMLIGIKKGDLVWTSPISFVASANCAKYCGAEIDYIDIDLDTFNVSYKNLKNKIEKSKKKKKLPKAIIIVHYGGFPYDLEKIYKIAKKNNIFVIEDASHALGAKYKNSKIGSCKYSDITVFSFHPVKIITTGEGGMMTTNNFNFYKKMQMLRSHGITNNYKYFKNNNSNKWYFEQQYLGFNYRMNDLEAALGISQLKNINKNLISRRHLAKRYFNYLTKKVEKISLNSFVESSYHLFPILINKEVAGIDRDNFFKFLYKKGIRCQIHYIPIFKHPYHRINLKKQKKLFPNSLKFYNSVISLPMYYGLSDADQNYIINTVNKKIENK